jgi:chromosome segregation ATPase
MVNWNSFKITERAERSNYVRFHLDGYVSYSSGSERYIDCTDTAYFSEWKEGDCVRVDFEKTREFSSSRDFTFYDNAIFKSWTSNPELSRVRSDYYSLQSSHSSLQSRNSELCSDKSRLQSEIYSLQSQNSNLQSQISSLRTQNSEKDKQIAILNSQLASVQSQLRNKEGELVTTKKGLEELRGLFNDLTMTNNNKDHELEKKEKKIRELKELLGKTKEEILDYKIKTKEGRLETLIQKLEIDRGKIRELRGIYQQLVRVGVNNKDDIDDIEDKIEVIRDDLVDKGISIVDAKKLCQKCEKIAKLKLEQDKLYQERFEAKQEVVVYNNKN